MASFTLTLYGLVSFAQARCWVVGVVLSGLRGMLGSCCRGIVLVGTSSSLASHISLQMERTNHAKKTNHPAEERFLVMASGTILQWRKADKADGTSVSDMKENNRKLHRLHPPDLVHMIISMNQSPKCVPTVDLHVEGTEATSKGVQHQHVVDESLLRALSKLGEERKQGTNDETATQRHRGKVGLTKVSFT